MRYYGDSIFAIGAHAHDQGPRRRLLVVRLLLRGPASGAGLIAAIQAELGDEGNPPAAAAALKHDLDALEDGARADGAVRRQRGVIGDRS